MTQLPEWAGRQVLAEALKACGLPWVPAAVWRRPRQERMTYGERLAAIGLVGRVIAEARRRLPGGTSGAALDRAWRDVAWRCTVAGLALLDAQARERMVGRRDDEDDEHDLPAVQAEPVVIRRRVAEAPVAMPAAQATLTIRRRGEVARAS